MKTRNFLVRATLTAVVSFAAQSAHAIPITFTFSGTVETTSVTSASSGSATYDHSLDGLAFNAWITIDTDGLVRSQGTDGDGTISLQLNDLASDPAEWTTSGLTIGGIAYDVGMYGRDYGQIAVNDYPGPVCAPTTCFDRPDLVNISDRSAEYSPSNAPDGQYQDIRLNFTLFDLNNPNGLIDLAQGFEATDLLSLPLTSANSTFARVTRECLGGTCTVANSTVTDFLVSSWTITTASSASAPSVPEPATLALFAVGLLGTAAARRVRRSSH
jgi:hypothetical protein